MVENRPGAGAVIGLTALARSVPDGYTLALSGSTLAVSGALYKKPPFDAAKDFAPVALVTHYPFVLVVNASLPVHSVRGADPIGQGATRPAALRLARRRLLATPLYRAVQEHGRHRGRSHSL